MQITIKVEIRLTEQEWKDGADKVLRDQPYEWERTLSADPDTLTAFCVTLNSAMQQMDMAPLDTTPDEPEWETPRRAGCISPDDGTVFGPTD